MYYYTLKIVPYSVNDNQPIFPQIQKMSHGYDYKAKNSVHALARDVYNFPDYIPNLDHFVLHNKTVLTDVLSNALLTSSGLLISEKFKNLLAEFKIMSHRFYDAKVLYKGRIYQYYWIHFKLDLLKNVNFHKSSFVVLLNYAHNLGPINIASIEDYYEKKDKIKDENPGKTVSIWVDKIVFNASFNNQLDLFKIGSFDDSIYISPNLKKAINETGITGCLVESTPKIKCN